MNCSTKADSLRTGVIKVVTYRAKVVRSMKSMPSRMMRKPPKAITSTDRMPMKNSMPD